MPAGYFVVRAVVADPADRAPFDDWYERAHLPDATAAFAAESSWRAWSRTDPSVHCAYYRFDTVAAAESVSGSAALAQLAAEFDARWKARVVRTREVLSIAGAAVDGPARRKGAG